MNFWAIEINNFIQVLSGMYKSLLPSPYLMERGKG
jgi:hypothetical protein